MKQMEFVHPSPADWQLFLSWAGAENWRVPEREQRLFQDSWRRYFFTLRTAGTTQGFVSAVAYPDSGWIGNLLVDPEGRGRGYGSALFDFALEYLWRKPKKGIWLTASKDGLPLYQRRGFAGVDRVERWQGTGLGQTPGQGRNLLAELIELDRTCWGESRALLLRSLGDAEICHYGDSLALLQSGADAWQLGPWLSPNNCPRENRLLLTEALEKTPAGTPLVIDSLVSAELGPLLRGAGLILTGSTELMFLGRQAKPKLRGVAALASLGSVG